MCDELFFITHFFNFTIERDDKLMSSKLYKKDNYINDNIFFLFNKDITEYDMSDAGFSLIQEFGLLDSDIINKLSKMKKDKRKIEIGNIQRKNQEFKERLKDSFADARMLFFELNNIDDTELISIKKDAIITTQFCKQTKIGKFINFRPKHFYTSYIRLDRRLELYYSPNDFAVKGIGDEMLEDHKDYMIKFIKTYFHKMETSDKSTVIEFTRNFIDKYKSFDLPVGYYRNFDIKSEFCVVGDTTKYKKYWEDEKENLDINYNYFNVLLKLIKIPL